MEPEELFRKLRPLLGRRLDALWREYYTDRASRPEIEEILHVLALRHLRLGPGAARILLPPPPQAKADGAYRLGTVEYAGRETGPFGLREDEWIQHVAIFGRSGSGKTNAGFLILEQLLAHAKPVWVFDWKRNYRDVAERLGLTVVTVGRKPRPFFFNPLEPPPGADRVVWYCKLTEVMAQVYGVRQAATYVLQRAFFDAFERAGRKATFETVGQVLEERRGASREGQWLQSAKRVVGTLCSGPLSRVYHGTPPPLADLLAQPVVFELDALTDADKAFFVDTLLLWLQQYRLQQEGREDFKHAVLIEEAHHVVLRRRQSREGVMDVVLREIRELGEAVILIDQHPSLVSIPSLGNTYCTIVMNLKHGNDVSAIGAALRLDAQAREYLGRLPLGSAIVRLQGRWPHPFLITLSKYDVQKGSVRDEQLPGKPSYSTAWPDVRAAERMAPAIQPARPNHHGLDPTSRQPNADELKSLLKDVCTHPLAGVAERYRRLGWSADRGTRLKEELVRRGQVRTTRIRLTNGNLLVLVPTRSGLAMLDGERTWPAIDEHASPEHEFWKGWLFNEIRKRGRDVHAEYALSNGHRVDLLVRDGPGALPVAIEIETGKSDAYSNVKALRSAGIDRIVLVATSKEAVPPLQAAIAADTVGVLLTTAAALVADLDTFVSTLT